MKGRRDSQVLGFNANPVFPPLEIASAEASRTRCAPRIRQCESLPCTLVYEGAVTPAFYQPKMFRWARFAPLRPTPGNTPFGIAQAQGLDDQDAVARQGVVGQSHRPSIKRLTHRVSQFRAALHIGANNDGSYVFRS